MFLELVELVASWGYHVMQFIATKNSSKKVALMLLLKKIVEEFSSELEKIKQPMGQYRP